ncbi:MAG: Gfo/Idh/MocA family oxidoreductase, partial [Chlamydiia bacterium]|nr:Gfo/Idh/MocA family oxidoreductase [Chlamydiia bacterium]
MEHSKNTSAHVALIGGGRWGKNLLRAFHATGALRWVCDASDAVLSQLQSKYSDLQFTQHFEEVMSDPQVTAVAIATPAFTHPELVRICLEAGKDVFVEKPLAFDTQTALSLTLLAEEKKRILMTGHLLQYHPVFLELLRTVHQGEFGALHFLNSNRLSTGPIRHEENALWNFAPHDVSMILALHKQTLPTHVRAIGGCHITPGIVDNCHVILQFEEGGHAVIHNSWLHPYKEHKLSVVGERGMAIFDDTKIWTEKLEIQQEFMSV